MSGPAREWARGWQMWEEMGLEIYRKNATDERIRTIAGRNRQWETKIFTQAELKGSVKMRVDYNGLFPKSLATERATITQLIQLGILSPGDPEVNYQILEAFGETNLKGSVDVATREAVKENEKFMSSDGYTPKVDVFSMNHQVHLMVHLNLTPIDEFKKLPAGRQNIFLQHIKDHVFAMTQKQKLFAQLAAAGANAGGPDPTGMSDGSMVADPRLQAPGGPGGKPMPRSGHGQIPPTPDMATPPGGGGPLNTGLSSPLDSAPGGLGAAQEPPSPAGPAQ